MTLVTLTQEEVHEFHRLSRYYWKEAVRCEEAKAWLAGCVMLAAALETLLALMINIFSDEALATGKAPRTKGKNKPLIDWTLSEMLVVAKAAGWLPAGLTLSDDWNNRKAQIGDYAEVLRMIRNLIHPARYTRDHCRNRITAKYLKQQFGVCLACRDWLAERNHRALREHMKAEGLH